MKWGVAVLGAALAVSFASSVSSCSADCSCAGPAVTNAPESAAPGTSVTLNVVNLYKGSCCDTGRMPWQPEVPPTLSEVTVQLTDNNHGVLDEQTVDVADDATASVTLNMPNAGPIFVTVEIDGEADVGFWVKASD